VTGNKSNEEKKKSTKQNKNKFLNNHSYFESLSKEMKVFIKTLSSVGVDVDHFHPSLKSLSSLVAVVVVVVLIDTDKYGNVF
jgi:hypothetical protein